MKTPKLFLVDSTLSNHKAQNHFLYRFIEIHLVTQLTESTDRLVIYIIAPA